MTDASAAITHPNANTLLATILAELVDKQSALLTRPMLTVSASMLH